VSPPPRADHATKGPAHGGGRVHVGVMEWACDCVSLTKSDTGVEPGSGIAVVDGRW
jgi:hypothetical protein